MGGETKTVTQQQSGLTNPAMEAAGTTIGNQLNAALQGGVKADTTNRVPALSSQTQQGIYGLTNNPSNSIFSAGINSAIGQQADIAAGNVQNDVVRQRALDDALKASNAVFTTSGRFGSGSHATNLAEGATNALAGLDYSRQQQAIQNLPSLYSASNMPAAANLQAGQLMDAYNTANSQEQARIFDATNNANWNTLQRGGAIFSGTAPVTGTTSTGTQTQQTPWWQQVLGGGLLGSGIYGNIRGN